MPSKTSLVEYVATFYSVTQVYVHTSRNLLFIFFQYLIQRVIVTLLPRPVFVGAGLVVAVSSASVYHREAGLSSPGV